MFWLIDNPHLAVIILSYYDNLRKWFQPNIIKDHFENDRFSTFDQ